MRTMTAICHSLLVYMRRFGSSSLCRVECKYRATHLMAGMSLMIEGKRLKKNVTFTKEYRVAWCVSIFLLKQ